jgi:hypothetical protein
MARTLEERANKKFILEEAFSYYTDAINGFCTHEYIHIYT